MEFFKLKSARLIPQSYLTYLVPTKFIHCPELKLLDCPLLFQEKMRCDCCLQLRHRFCDTSAQLRRHWMVS